MKNFKTVIGEHTTQGGLAASTTKVALMFHAYRFYRAKRTAQIALFDHLLDDLHALQASCQKINANAVTDILRIARVYHMVASAARKISGPGEYLSGTDCYKLATKAYQSTIDARYYDDIATIIKYVEWLKARSVRKEVIAND